ncbi:S-adenosyl-L-methionine-dependent methyltransferase [Hypoxylon trugodes]|uniref:S-adenosyl-L-methionine-dependent methyltransferase n=1 Tax=Hypoxylon trugodes TaxID=326681 RepID=UPI0021900C19|nr:S-adenosyl-L-methionine-dependent methyltransferase [Hypoxylon trugodes]KAI1384818.1 S-adenosyl-L-methionine-dependent methyltransferase [Hypoxylon trugodes]
MSSKGEVLQGALELTNTLQQHAEEPLTESERVSALKTARGLVASLEKTEDAVLKLGYTPLVWMVIRIFVELNIFSILSEKDEISVRELAQRTGADELLLRRLFRVLTASNYVAEKGPGIYGPTKWTEHLSKRTTEGTVRWIYDIPMLTTALAPSWFKQKGHHNPLDPKDGAFHNAFDAKGIEIFPWLAKPENKRHWDDANTYFEGDRGSRPSWVTWFPVREKLLSGDIDSEAPLLVDVGGGRGHDITEFEQQFPDVAGRLVLQDQPPVLDTATSLSSRIEKHGLNFFVEAPVKDARIYFMKFIIHDYDDEKCLQILKNVKASMKKGHSYLVINDFILPEVGCELLPAMWDLLMMTVVASMERSESQWKSLLEAAGLAIEGFYQPPGDGQGIVVATLK